MLLLLVVVAVVPERLVVGPHGQPEPGAGLHAPLGRVAADDQDPVPTPSALDNVNTPEDLEDSVLEAAS